MHRSLICGKKGYCLYFLHTFFMFQIDTPDEIVLVVSPDNLPWFLNILLKDLSLPLNLSWHIHSSVPTEKVPIIKAFVKNLPILAKDQKVNLRLIFKCGKLIK